MLCCGPPPILPRCTGLAVMTLASMTGFARSEGHGDGMSWVWEIKSVNGKSLDLRFRLPPGFDALELPIRATISERLRRGAVTVSLTIAQTASKPGIRINREVLGQIIALAREIEGQIDVAPPRIDGLLALRGVLESGEEIENEATQQRRQALLLSGWEKTIEALVTARRAEGTRLHLVLMTRLDEIASLVVDAERTAAAQPAQIKARLSAMLAALLDAAPALPEDRLAQEAALALSKADIREELDRLGAHIQAARELVTDGVAVGRRLDFLCQEFNREANTLCSKSADVTLTRIGLALKAVIEQLREQVQNIE